MSTSEGDHVALTPDQIESIRELRASGHNVSQIRTNLGHSRVTIYKYREKREPRETAPTRRATLLTERADARCRAGDHSWLSEDRFEGHAFEEARFIEPSPSKATFLTHYRRSCAFCPTFLDVPYPAGN